MDLWEERIMASLKSSKLALLSPAQNADPKGGPGAPKSPVKIGGVGSGKGTKSHFSMDTPDKSGGGWSTGKKK